VRSTSSARELTNVRVLEANALKWGGATDVLNAQSCSLEFGILCGPLVVAGLSGLAPMLGATDVTCASRRAHPCFPELGRPGGIEPYQVSRTGATAGLPSSAGARNTAGQGSSGTHDMRVFRSSFRPAPDSSPGQKPESSPTKRGIDPGSKPALDHDRAGANLEIYSPLS
jgi:hypothetical protein